MAAVAITTSDCAIARAQQIDSPTPNLPFDLRPFSAFLVPRDGHVQMVKAPLRTLQAAL